MQFHKNYYLLHKLQKLIEERGASDFRSQFMCSKKPLVWLENEDRGVQIVKRGKHAHYHGLMTCGNVWGCPVCAAQKLEDYYYKILAVSKALINQGYSAAMVTFTISHGPNDSAAHVYKCLSKLYKLFTHCRTYTNAAKKYGLAGAVQAYECTYGKNGFHWHIHALYFYNNLTAGEAVNLEREYCWEWYRLMVKVKPETTNIYSDVGMLMAQTHNRGVYFSKTSTGAIRLSNDFERCASYITKAASELAKSNHKCKTGDFVSDKHYHMLELLASDDPELQSKYLEYVRAAKRHYRIYISPYLRARAKIDINAEALRLHAEETENFTPPEVVCKFGDIAWSNIVCVEREQGIPLRAILLVQAINGGAEAVIRLCQNYDIDVSDISVGARVA